MKRFKVSMAITAGVLFSMSALAGSKDMVVSTAERNQMMRAAQVWENPGDISQKDIMQGPGTKFALNQNVTCTFYDGYYTKLATTGATQKFWCVEKGKDPSKGEVKVKYNDTNGEVFAEVISSRLLWALGFFADKAYPVSVNCENCPDNPWSYLHHVAAYKRAERSGLESSRSRQDDEAAYIQDAQARRQKLNDDSMRTTGQPFQRRYEIALSEGHYDGAAIFEDGNPKAGVGLDELSLINEQSGGSSQAQVDALRLLVAFIKDGDNKRDNQRLVCPNEFIVKAADGKVSCSHPRVVMQDIGATIGNGASHILAVRFINESSKIDFKAWRDTPVWDNLATCKARLDVSTFGASMKSPTVSEAGRKFLADLMVQLTDQQITDIFTVARADQRKGRPTAEISQWVELFKAKRAEIVNARCPR